MDKGVIILSSSKTSTTSSSASCKTTSTSCSSSSTTTNIFKHGSILKHVRQYQKPNFRSSNVDILQLCNTAISICYCYCIHLAVHIIFGFNKLSSVDFSGNCLASNDVAF